MGRLSILVLALVACAQQAGETRCTTGPVFGAVMMTKCKTEPTKPGPVRAAAPPAEPETTATQVINRLSARMKQDPIGALRELGLTEDDFQGLSQKLYVAWKLDHPDPPAVTTPAPPHVATATSRPVERAWWCFDAPGWADCEPTIEDCEAARLKRTEAACQYQTETLARDACQRVAASVDDIGLCRRQDMAACFTKFMVMYGHDQLGCAPAMSSCKSRRAAALKTMTDDIKVKSDCVPTAP